MWHFDNTIAPCVCGYVTLPHSYTFFLSIFDRFDTLVYNGLDASKQTDRKISLQTLQFFVNNCFIRDVTNAAVSIVWLHFIQAKNLFGLLESIHKIHKIKPKKVQPK
jgi:hypothetical protein